MNEGEFWFKAKRRGWGWTPVTVRGWTATIGYFAALGLWLYYWFKVGRYDAEPVVGVVPVLLLTGGFFLLCWLKGERPRWRWGK